MDPHCVCLPVIVRGACYIQAHYSNEKKSVCFQLSQVVSFIESCLILVSLHIYQNIEAEIDQDFNTKCWLQMYQEGGRWDLSLWGREARIIDLSPTPKLSRTPKTRSRWQPVALVLDDHTIDN